MTVVTAGFTALEVAGLDVVLALHTAKDPTPEDWQRYIELLKKAKEKNRGDISRVRCLVVTDGGAPNAKQREMRSRAAGGPLKMAGISSALDFPVMRGIATAIAWANPSFKAVMPAQWKDALQFLDLAGHHRPILFEFDQIQRNLPPIGSLALLIAEMKKDAA